jgi:hypothetical protein
LRERELEKVRMQMTRYQSGHQCHARQVDGCSSSRRQLADCDDALPVEGDAGPAWQHLLAIE